MGMQLPSGLRNLFYGLTGSKWFTADETTLRALSDLLDQTGGRIETEIPPLVTSVKRRVRTTFDSRAADYFEESIDKFTAGNTNYVKAAADAAHQLADFVREAANQVEYVKWMIIGQLIQLALEIAWAIAMAKWSFGASLTMIPVFERIASLAIQQLLRFLFNTLLVHLVVSVTFAMTLDQLIQRAQMAKGNRKGNDDELSTAAGVGGVFDGLFSAGFSWLGGRFADWITDNFGGILKNYFKIEPDAALPPGGGRGPGPEDLPGNGPPSPKIGGDDQVGGAPTPKGGRDDVDADGPRPKGDDAPTPAPVVRDEPTPQPPPVRTPETVPPRLADDMADALARNASDLARPFGRNPRPWDNVATTARFRDDVGKVFESNLGDRLGRDAARDLGRNYADTFIANWGTRDIGGSLARVLNDAPTGLGGRQLSPETRAFLSQTLPEGTTKGLTEFADNWRRTAAHFGTNVAEAAGSNYLGEGFSNMALSEDHKFDANGMSAVAGAANVALTTGGVLGGIKGLDALENLFGSNMTVDVPPPPVMESDSVGAANDSEVSTGGGSTGGSGGAGGSGSGGGSGAPGRGNGPEGGEAPSDTDAGPGTPEAENADLRNPADSPGSGDVPDTDERVRPVPPPDVPSSPEVPMTARDDGDPTVEPPSGAPQGQDTGGTDAPAAPPPRMEDPSMSRFEDDGGDRPLVDGPSDVVAPPDAGTPQDVTDTDEVRDHPFDVPVAGDGFTGAPSAMTGTPPPAQGGDGAGASRPGSTPRGEGTASQAARTQAPSSEADAPSHSPDTGRVRTTGDTDSSADSNRTDIQSDPDRPMSDRAPESDPERVGPEVADGPHEGTTEAPRTPSPHADLDELGGLYDDPPAPSRTESDPVDPDDPWRGNPPKGLDLGALQDPKGGKDQPPTIGEVIADLTEYRYALDDVLPSAGDAPALSVNLADRFHYHRSYDDGFADYDDGSNGQYPTSADDGEIFDFSPSTSPTPQGGGGYGGYPSLPTSGHPSTHQGPGDRAPIDGDWTLDDLDDQSPEDAFYHSDESDAVPAQPVQRHPRVPGIPTHNPFLSGPAGTGLPPVVGGLLEFHALWGVGATAPDVRTFADNAEAIGFGRDHWDGYVQDLPEREADAVRAYTAAGTYRQMNTALRSGGRLDSETRQYIRRMDRALAGRPVPEDVMVTRGMGISHLPMSPQDMVDQGTRFHERGYLSTALGHAAPSFDNNEAVLYMRIPAGTPAIWMERLSTYGVQERELVLGRDLEWSIVDAVHRDGQWHMMVEVAPDSLPAAREGATTSSRFDGNGDHHDPRHDRTGGDQHGGFTDSGGRIGQRTAPLETGRTVRFDPPEVASAHPSATRSADPAADRPVTAVTRTPVPDTAGAPVFGPPVNHRPGDPAPLVADLPGSDQWGPEQKPKVRRFSGLFADTLKPPADAPPLTVDVNTENGPMRARVRIHNLFFESTTREIHRESDDDEGPSSVLDVKLRVLSLPAQSGMDKQAQAAASRALNQHVEAVFNDQFVLPRGGRQLNVSVVPVTSGTLENVHARVSWSPVPSAADGSPPPALGPDTDGRGIGEVLRRLGMLDGDPARGEGHPYVARRTLERIETMVEPRPARRKVDPQRVEPARVHTGLADPSVWEGARADVPVHQVGGPNVSAEWADPGTDSRAARPLDIGPGGDPVDPATVVDNPDARPGDPQRFVKAEMNSRWADRRFEWARIPIPEENRTQGGPTHVLELTFRPRIHRDEGTTTPERYETYLREYAATLDAMWNRQFRIRGDGTVVGAKGTRVHKLGDDLFSTLFGEGSRPDRDDMEVAYSVSGAESPPHGSGDQLHIRLLLADDSTPDDQVHSEIYLESRPDTDRMDMTTWNTRFPVEAGVHETGHRLGLIDEYFDPSTVFRGSRDANAVRPGDDAHGYGVMGNEWVKRGADGKRYKHRDPVVLNGYLDTITSMVEHGTSDYTRPPRVAELSAEVKSDILRILDPGLTENDPRRFEVFERFALAIDVFARGWGIDRVAEQLVAPGDAAALGVVREQLGAAADARAEARREGARAEQARALGDEAGAQAAAARAGEFEAAARAADVRAAQARARATDSGVDVRLAQARAAFEANLGGWRESGRLARAMDLADRNGVRVSTSVMIDVLPGAMRDTLEDVLTDSTDLANADALAIFAAGRDHIAGRARIEDIPDVQGRPHITAGDVKRQIDKWRGRDELIDAFIVLADSSLGVTGREWIGALPERTKEGVARRLWSGSDPALGGLGLGLDRGLDQAGLSHVALEVFSAGFDQMLYRAPARGLTITVPDGSRVQVTATQVYGQLKAWRKQGTLADVLNILRNSGVVVPDDVLARASTRRAGQRTVPVGPGRPVPFEPTDVVSANPSATARTAAPPPADHNDVLTVPFARSDAALSEAGRSEIEDFVQRRVDEAYRALLHNRQLPATEVRGHGSRAGASDTAESRGEQVSHAYREFVQRRGVHRLGIFADDLFPTVLAPSRGQGGKETNRSAELRSVAPPARRVVVGGPGDSGRQVPRILHMNWFHGKMPEASAQNMRHWVTRATKAGWTVRLWTDDSANRRNRALFSDLAGTTGADGRPAVEVSTSPADALGIKGGARELHDFAVEREVWPMQSDIVRYHALATHGGMHVDSDIGPGSIDLSLPPPPMDADSVPMLAPLLRDQEQEHQVQQKVSGLGLLTGAGEAELPTPARYQWRLGDFNNNLIIAPPGSRFLNEMISGLALTDEVRKTVPRPLPQLEGTQAEGAKGAAAQFTGPGRMRTRLAFHIAAQEPRQIDGRHLFGEFRKGNWTVDPRYADYLSGVVWVTDDSADYDKYVATDSGSGSDSGGGPVRAGTAQAPDEGRRDPATSSVRFTASSEIGAGTSAAGGPTAGDSAAGGTGRGGREPRFLLREPAPVRDDLPAFDPRQETGRSEWVRSYPFVEEPDGAPSRVSVELDTSHGRMRADVEVHRPFYDSSVVEVPGENGADSRYVRQIEVRFRARANLDVASRGAATAASAALRQQIEALFNSLHVLPHSGDQLHVSVEPAESGRPYHADVVWHQVPPAVDGAPPVVPGPAADGRGTRDLLRRLGLLDHDPARGRGEPFVARQTLERIENAAPTRDGLSDFDQNWSRKRKRGDTEPKSEDRWFSRDLANALKLPDDAPPLSVEVGTGRGRIRAKVAFDARFFMSDSIETVRGGGEGDRGGPVSFRRVVLRVRAAAGDGVDEPGALAATMQVKRYVEELYNRKYVLPRSGEQLHVSVVVLESDHPLDQVHATLTWSTVSSSQDGAQDPAPSGALEVAGIGEVLRRLGMLDGDPARGEDHPYVARRTLDRIEAMAGTGPPQRRADPQGEVPLSDHEHKVVGNPAKWRGAGRDEWEIARAAARVHQVGAHVSSAGAEIQRSARAARPLGENDFDAHGALKNPAGVVAEGTALGVPRFVSADMKAKWVAPRRFEHRRIPIPERYRKKTGKDGPTHVQEITFRVRPIRHSSMTKGQFDAYLKDYAKKLDAMFNGQFRLRGDGSLLDQSGTVVHRLSGDLFETLFGRDSVRDPKDLKGNEITVPGADPLPGTGDQLHIRLELVKDTTPSRDVHATPIVRHYEDGAQSKDIPGMDMLSWHDGYPVEAAVHETAHWLGLMDEYFDPRSVFRWRRRAGAVRVDGALMTNVWTKFSEGRVRKVQDPTLRTRYADTIASVMDHGTSDYAPPRWADMTDEDKFLIVHLLEPGLGTSDPRRFEVFDRFAPVIDVFARGWGTDRVAEQFVAPADAAARGAVREQMSIAADARVAARREGVRAAQARASGEDTRAREADARAVEFEEVARAADARATVARKHSADSGADSRVTQVRAAFEAEFNGWRADGRLLRVMDMVMASADLFDALVPPTALIRALPPGAMRSLAQGLSGSNDPGNGNLALSIFAAGFDRAFGQGPFTDIPAGHGHRAISARGVEAQLEHWRGGNTLVMGLRVFHDHGARVWGRKWIGALPDAGRAAVVATLLPVGGPRQNSVLGGLGPLPRPVLERVVLDLLGVRYDHYYNDRLLRGIKVAAPGHPDVLLTKDQVDSQLREWSTEGVLAPAAKQLARWYVPTNKPGPRSTVPALTVPPRQQAAPGGEGAPAPFTADPHNRPAEFVPAQETGGGHEERGNPVTAFTGPAYLPEPVPEPTDAMAGLDRAYLDPDPVVANSDPRRFVPLSPDNFDTDTATEPAEAAPGPSVREATRVAPQDGSATAPTPPDTSGRTPPATEPQPSLADTWDGVLNPTSRSRDGSVHGDAHHQVAPSENGTDTLGARNVTEPAESSRAEDVPPVVGDPDPVRERTDAEHERELARARRGKRPEPAAAERFEAETLEAEADQARLRAETERDLADESAIRTAAAARDAAPTTSSRVEDMTTEAAVREDQAIRTDRLAEHMGDLARRARLRAEAAKRAADRELDEPARERPTGTRPEVARAGGVEPDTHAARTPGHARDTSGAEERAPGSEPVPQTAPEPVPGVPEVTEASHGQEPGAPPHPPVTVDAAPKDRSDVTDAPPTPSQPDQSAQPAGADTTRGTEPPVVPPRPRPRRTGQDGPDPVRPPEQRDDVSGRARNPEDREATTPPSPDPAATPSSTPLPTPGRRLNYLLRSGQIDSPLIGPAADRIIARIRADLSGRLSHGEINAIERRVRADFARDSRPYFAPGGHTFTIPGRSGERRVILKLSPEGDSWRLAPESGLAAEEGPDSAPRAKTKSTAEHKTKVSRKGAATSTAAVGGSFKITAYGLVPPDSAVGPAFSFSIKGAHNQRSTSYSVSDGAVGRSEVSLKGDLEEFLSDLRVELTVDPPVDPLAAPRGGLQGMADRFRDRQGSADVELSERPVVLSVVEPGGLSMSVPGGLKDRDAAVDAATDAPERIVLPDPFDNGPRIPGTQNGQGTRVGSGHPLAVEPIHGLKGQIRQQLGVDRNNPSSAELDLATAPDALEKNLASLDRGPTPMALVADIHGVPRVLIMWSVPRELTRVEDAPGKASFSRSRKGDKKAGLTAKRSTNLTIGAGFGAVVTLLQGTLRLNMPHFDASYKFDAVSTRALSTEGAQTAKAHSKEVETYKVERVFYAMLSGDATLMSSWGRSIEQIAVADARRMAGLDEPTDEAGARRVPRFDHLAVDRPAHWGGTTLREVVHEDGSRYRTATPANGATNSAPRPTTVYEDYASAVLNGIADEHPGMVVPDLVTGSKASYARRPGAGPDGHRTPREFPVLRRNYHQAIANTIMVLDAMTPHNLEGRPDEWMGAGIDLLLIETTSIDPTLANRGGLFRPPFVPVRLYADATGRVFGGTSTMGTESTVAGSAGQTDGRERTHTWTEQLSVGVRGRDPAVDAAGARKNVGMLDATAEASQPRGRTQEHGVKGATESTVKTTGDTDVWRYGVDLMAKMGKFRKADDLAVIDDDDGGAAARARDGVVYDGHAITIQGPRARLEVESPAGRDVEHAADRTTAIHQSTTQDGTTDRPTGRRRLSDTEARAVVLGTARPPAPHPMDGVPTATTTVTAPDLYRLGNRLLTDTIPGFQEFLRRSRGAHDYLRQLLLPPMLGGNVPQMLSRFGLRSGRLQVDTAWRWRGLPTLVLRAARGGFRLYEVMPTTTVEVSSSGEVSIGAAGTRGGHTRSLGFSARFRHNPNDEAPSGGGPASGTDTARSGHPTLMPGGRWTPYSRSATENTAMSVTFSRATKVTPQGGAFPYTADLSFDQAAEVKKDWKLGVTVPRRTSTASHHGVHIEVPGAEFGYIAEAEAYAADLVDDAVGTDTDGTPIATALLGHHAPRPNWEPRPGFVGLGHYRQGPDAGPVVDDLFRRLAAEGLELTGTSREELFQRVGAHITRGLDDATARAVPIDVKVRSTSLAHSSSQGKITFDVIRRRGEVDRVGAKADFVDSRSRATEINESRGRQKDSTVGGGFGLVGTLSSSDEQPPSSQTPDKRPVTLLPGIGNASRQSGTSTTRNTGDSTTETVDTLVFGPYAVIGTDASLRLYLETKGHVIVAEAPAGRMSELYPAPYLIGTGESAAEALRAGAPRLLPSPNQLLDPAAGEWAADRRSGARAPMPWLEALSVAGDGAAVTAAGYIATARASGWQPPQDVSAPALVRAARDYLVDKMGPRAENIHVALTGLALVANFAPAADGGKGLPNLFRDRLITFADLRWRLHAVPRAEGARLIDVSVDSAHGGSRKGEHKDETTADHPSTTTGGATGGAIGSVPDEHRSMGFVNDTQSTSVSSAAGASKSTRTDHPGRPPVGSKRAYLVAIPTTWLVAAESPVAETRHMGFSRDQVGMAEVESEALAWVDHDQARELGVLEGVEANKALWDGLYTAQEAFGEAEKTYFDARQKLPELVRGVQEAHRSGDAGPLSDARAAYTAQRTTVDGLHRDLLRNFEVWNAARAAARESLRPTGPERTLREAHPDQEEERTRAARAAVDAQRATMNRPHAEAERVYTDEDAGPAKPASTVESTARPDRQVPPTPAPSAPPPPPHVPERRSSPATEGSGPPKASNVTPNLDSPPAPTQRDVFDEVLNGPPPVVAAPGTGTSQRPEGGRAPEGEDRDK